MRVVIRTAQRPSGIRPADLIRFDVIENQQAMPLRAPAADFADLRLRLAFGPDPQLCDQLGRGSRERLTSAIDPVDAFEIVPFMVSEGNGEARLSEARHPDQWDNRAELFQTGAEKFDLVLAAHKVIRSAGGEEGVAAGL